MKVLITGGAGLIGSALGRRLMDAGHEVLVLDNFTYSYAPTTSPSIHADTIARVETLLDGAQIERCSTLEKLRLYRLYEEFQPDRVVHLAAIPLVSVATREIEDAAASISTGLINVLEVMRMLPGADRFVYASSSMVYGNFTKDPMPEEGETNPINIYGGLKLAGEVITKSYLYPTGIDPVIVRPSAVYGPTDQHRRVVQKFCENMLRGQPIHLNARNDHTMDFTYVDDIADGFYLATTHDNAARETFNMTFGHGRPLSDLARILREIDPALRLSGDEINDADRPRRGSLCIDKARRLLGYAPQWPLEKAIPIYVDAIRASQGARN